MGNNDSSMSSSKANDNRKSSVPLVPVGIPVNSNLESHPDLTAEENKQLKNTYSLMLSQSNRKDGISRDVFTSHLSLIACPHLPALLFDSTQSNNVITWKSFRDIIVDIVRSNASYPINLTFKLIVSDVSIDKETQIYVFFLLLLEFSGCLDESCSLVASNLSQYYVVSGESSFSAFVLTNFPCSAQVISSYFYSKFCTNCKNTKQFNLPQLSAQSSIIKDISQVFPLSLYTEKLQGSWILLFSSDVHGFSFNRIAHHILGYNVLYCTVFNIN